MASASVRACRRLRAPHASRRVQPSPRRPLRTSRFAGSEVAGDVVEHGGRGVDVLLVADAAGRGGGGRRRTALPLTHDTCMCVAVAQVTVGRRGRTPPSRSPPLPVRPAVPGDAGPIGGQPAASSTRDPTGIPRRASGWSGSRRTRGVVAVPDDGEAQGKTVRPDRQRWVCTSGGSWPCAEPL